MTPYFIKICGITNEEDAMRAVEYGATAVGFNFYKESPRYISPDKASAIAEKIKKQIHTVGVFVNEEISVVRSVGAQIKLTFCQFHGDEPPEYVNSFSNAIKTFRVNDSLKDVQFDDYSAAAFLLDTFSDRAFGGTGKNFNWLLAREANDFGKIILAGGLTPLNVDEAISTVRPWGVDVSSGVESSPGKKDPEKMKEFITTAQRSLKELAE